MFCCFPRSILREPGKKTVGIALYSMIKKLKRMIHRKQKVFRDSNSLIEKKEIRWQEDYEIFWGTKWLNRVCTPKGGTVGNPVHMYVYTKDFSFSLSYFFSCSSSMRFSIPWIFPFAFRSTYSCSVNCRVVFWFRNKQVGRRYNRQYWIYAVLRKVLFQGGKNDTSKKLKYTRNKGEVHLKYRWSTTEVQVKSRFFLLVFFR